MRAPEFTALGFVTDNPQQLLTATLASGHVRGMQNLPGFDLLGAFNDPSGARLSLIRRKGQDITTTPALASPETHKAAVYRLSDQLAHLSLFRTDEPPLELLALVDDPTQYPIGAESFTLIQRLSLSAICVRADVYNDEEDFLRRRPDDDHPWSARTLVSTSIMGEGILAQTELTPRALAGFTIESAWRRTNELTGKEFWYGIGVSAVRFAFAMPVAINLRPGNVVLGTFTLSASSGLWDER